MRPFMVGSYTSGPFAFDPESENPKSEQRILPLWSVGFGQKSASLSIEQLAHSGVVLPPSSQLCSRDFHHYQLQCRI